jgi:hypothetical protein
MLVAFSVTPLGVGEQVAEAVRVVRESGLSRCSSVASCCWPGRRGGGRLRPFPVQMPSGSRYWTVLDEAMDVVPVADRYLRELRFGRDRAQETTKKYAGGIALFLRWCAATGRDWREAAADISLFMTWRLGPGATPTPGRGADQPGPGRDPRFPGVRGGRRRGTAMG